MINTKEDFLKLFWGDNKGITLVCKYSEKLKRNIMVQVPLSQIEKENSNGDIYFIVNSGGSKDENITQFNACFVDFDCGRREDKSYYPTDDVNIYKEGILNIINQFSISPTIITETRNGFHVYWCLTDNPTADKWINIQKRLILYFSSDGVIHNPARLMRLPFTNWMKDKNNPFRVSVKLYNHIKISYEMLDSVLPALSEGLGGKIPTNSSRVSNSITIGRGNTQTHKPKQNNIDTTTLYNIQAIKDRNIVYLQSVLNINDNIIFETKDEFYNYITNNIDLSKLIGVNEGINFRCIFHNDNNPSANVFKSKDGSWKYKCFSSSCCLSVTNIIGVIERLIQAKNKPQAYNFIKELYKITISETDWQKEQKEILEANIRMLYDNTFKEQYPYTYKNISRNFNILERLHWIAIDNIRDQKLVDNDSNVIFFSSLRYMASKLGLVSHGEMSKKLVLFQFHNLLNKISDENIPNGYLQKSKQLAKVNGSGGDAVHTKHINYMSMNSFTVDALIEAESNAKMWADRNMSVTGLCRENILRNFGEEKANELYPQYKYANSLGTMKHSDQQTGDIVKVIFSLIEDYGYATEKEICKILSDKYKQKAIQKQIKISMDEILNGYGLKRLKTNKVIKEHFQLECTGYPMIFISDTFELPNNT